MTDPRTSMNKILRRLAEIERARKARSSSERIPEPTIRSWQGHAVLDPSGDRIGHVTLVRLDGTGGAWLEVQTDLGVLDWLYGMGAGHNRLTFHSDDMDARGEKTLVLRQSILDEAEHHREAA